MILFNPDYKFGNFQVYFFLEEAGLQRGKF